MWEANVAIRGGNLYCPVVIYTPNLRSRITLFNQKREQGRFEESIKGVKRHSKGAQGERRGPKVQLSYIRWDTAQRKPDLAAPQLTTAAHAVDDISQKCSLSRSATYFSGIESRGGNGRSFCLESG